MGAGGTTVALGLRLPFGTVGAAAGADVFAAIGAAGASMVDFALVGAGAALAAGAFRFNGAGEMLALAALALFGFSVFIGV